MLDPHDVHFGAFRPVTAPSKIGVLRGAHIAKLSESIERRINAPRDFCVSPRQTLSRYESFGLPSISMALCFVSHHLFSAVYINADLGINTQSARRVPAVLGRVTRTPDDTKTEKGIYFNNTSPNTTKCKANGLLWYLEHCGWYMV